MDRRLASLICLASIACGGAARSGASPDMSPTANAGVYEYSASVPGREPGSTVRVNGTIAVVGDSLIIHPSAGCAQVETKVVSAVSVNCSGISLTFDRRNLSGGTWYSIVSVPKQRNACAQYEQTGDRARSPRCIRWRPETYYVQERRTGRVALRSIQ